MKSQTRTSEFRMSISGLKDQKAVVHNQCVRTGIQGHCYNALPLSSNSYWCRQLPSYLKKD